MRSLLMPLLDNIQTVIALLSFLGGLFMVYLRLYVGRELDRLRKDIIESLDARLVRRDMFDARLEPLEKRVASLESRRR